MTDVGVSVSGGRIVSLQILRFAAAAAVILMHIYRLWRWSIAGGEPGYQWTDVGGAGVDVFFVLSGFIIATTGPLAKRRPSASEFFYRRLTRVAPLFWLLSIPFIAGGIGSGSLNWPQTSATLFWPLANGGPHPPYLDPGWTLSFEVAFYTAVSVILVGGRVGRNAALGVVIVVALLAMRFLTGAVVARYLTSPTFLEFGLGVGLAYARPKLSKVGPAVGVAMLIGGLSIFALEAATGVLAHGLMTWRIATDGPGAAARLLICGLPACLIVAGALIANRLIHGSLAAFFGFLGDASYSIYLAGYVATGFLMIGWFHLFGLGRPLLMTGVIGLLSIGAGVACYLWVERPVLRIARRFPSPRWVERQQRNHPSTEIAVE